jgi:hypothetical protein
VSRERQCEHRVGGGNMPDEVVVVRAHLSGGSTVSGGEGGAEGGGVGELIGVGGLR